MLNHSTITMINNSAMVSEKNHSAMIERKYSIKNRHNTHVTHAFYLQRKRINNQI
jgi:hypothetical protein